MRQVLLFIAFGLVIALAACQLGAAITTPTPNLAPSEDEALAAHAIYDFFNTLQAGDYAEAAQQFGGSYDVHPVAQRLLHQRPQLLKGAQPHPGRPARAG